jgi:DNA-binding transcriptional LysR family regulator
MDSLQAYAAFVRTFEAGSFSAVARELGTTQSAVSKQIASLERSLGVQLFARTTRRLQPTAEALQLYEHVRQLLDAVDGVRAGERGAQLTGTLRVSAPSAYGRRRLCPLAPEFLRQHPLVRLEIVLTEQDSDLIGEGFELGVRIGELPASTLMARPIDSIEYLLVATPDYLERHGTPESPIELADHACIALGGSGRFARWEFESENGRQAVEVSGPVQVNDPDAVHALVCAHQGIGLLPRWVLGDDLERVRLRWLMPDYYPLSQRVSVVYPKTRFLSQRARRFIDFLLIARGMSVA